MDRLNCDIPLNDTEKKTEVAAPLSSHREFLRAAAASSGAAILSAEFVPTTSRASTDKVAELALPSATKALTPLEIHVPAAALDDLKRRLTNARWPDKEPVADWSRGVPPRFVRCGEILPWRRAATNRFANIEIHCLCRLTQRRETCGFVRPVG